MNDDDILTAIFADDNPIELSAEMKALCEQARNLAYLTLLDDDDMATVSSHHSNLKPTLNLQKIGCFLSKNQKKT